MRAAKHESASPRLAFDELEAVHLPLPPEEEASQPRPMPDRMAHSDRGGFAATRAAAAVSPQVVRPLPAPTTDRVIDAQVDHEGPAGQALHAAAQRPVSHEATVARPRS